MREVIDLQENICSIPINDVFLPKDGCPMCRMRDMLEERKAEYITGSAMMEPSVRIKTNEQGFCFRHFEMMVRLGKRLSNALILESHLQQISEEFVPSIPPRKPDKKKMAALDALLKDCFICRDIKQNMENMVRIVHAMWISEAEFRQLYAEQKFICLEHFYLLMNTDQKGLGKNYQASMRLPQSWQAVILKRSAVMFIISAPCLTTEAAAVMSGQVLKTVLNAL